MSDSGGERTGRALVTGGASGIGAACARRLAGDGLQVVVADVDADAADKVASDVGGEAWQVDLADTGALADLALDVDVLVNNAGIQHVAPVHEFPPDRFATILRLMVEAPFLLARASLPGMYARGFGRIVNVSSVHGLVASPYKSAYVAAKHALEGLSKVLALEGGAHGVTSNWSSRTRSRSWSRGWPARTARTSAGHRSRWTVAGRHAEPGRSQSPCAIRWGALGSALMPWLPDDFAHPVRVDLPTGEHLRPIRESDVDIDLPAVMGSRERLWSIYGEAWGWPPATMTHEQDREDLKHHEDEIAAHLSFNYALLDEGETELLGCVYIDPPEKTGGADAEISWWVVDGLVGTETERALDALVPRWIAADWPLSAPRYVGRDLSWAEWRALPDLPRE